MRSGTWVSGITFFFPTFIFLLVAAPVSAQDASTLSAGDVALSARAYSRSAKRKVSSASAIAGYEKAVAQDPGNSILANNLGVEYALAGRPEKAAEMLVRAVSIEPERVGFLVNLALVYRDSGRLVEAWALLDRGVRLAPADSRARQGMCDLEVMRGRHKEAAACYGVLGKISQLDAITSVNYGIALINSGDVAGGTQVLEGALRMYPDNGWVLNGLGIANFRRKRFESAVEWLRKAVEGDPHQDEFRYNLAIAQLANKNRSDALAQYRKLQNSDSKLAYDLYKQLFSDKVVFVGKK